MNRHRAYWCAMGDNRPYEEIEKDIMERNKLYEQALEEVKSLLDSDEMKMDICKKLIIGREPKYANVVLISVPEFEEKLIEVINIIKDYSFNSCLIRYEYLERYIISLLREELTKDE